MNLVIPKEILLISKKLKDNSFEAHLVGGCVRDLLRDKEPKDWDLATDATPENVLEIFPHAHYDNEYGTVRVVNDETAEESLKIVEITTYRLESDYPDNRRPESVIFSTKLEDDLKRRDFTINALALNVSRETPNLNEKEVVDLYGGKNDLVNSVIRAVGDPVERFGEDALRMLRAIRLAVELDFSIETKTAEAIRALGNNLDSIAKERIRDEFTRIIMSDHPKQGVELCHELGVLTHIIPELEEGVGIKQNQAHSYEVWEHLLRSLEAAGKKGWPLETRLAALLHDVSKPHSRRWDENKKDWTFHGHEVVGARTAKRALQRLKYPNRLIEKVSGLVRWHMFFSDTDMITLSAVRRLVKNVGEENVWDLMNIRVADRVGTGRPKETPYRLRKYKSMIEEALRDPLSVGMLKIDGEKVMDITSLKPGPKVGHILHALLEEVLDDPKRNTELYLEKKAIELSELDEKTLKKKGEVGKEKREKKEEDEVKKIRDKHWVK